MFNRLCAAVISLRPQVPEQHYHDLSLTPRRGENSHRTPEGNNRRAERGRERKRGAERASVETRQHGSRGSLLSLPVLSITVNAA